MCHARTKQHSTAQATSGCCSPPGVLLLHLSALLLLKLYLHLSTASLLSLLHQGCCHCRCCSAPLSAVKAGQKHSRILLNPSVSVLSGPGVNLNLTYAGSPYKATAIEATAKQVRQPVIEKHRRCCYRTTLSGTSHQTRKKPRPASNWLLCWL